MIASRLALLLLDIGFTNFRILDGGLYNYALMKGEVERYTTNTAAPLREGELLKLSTYSDKKILITAKEAYNLHRRDRVLLMDSRTRAEFQKGHPPGALWSGDSSEYRDKYHQKLEDKVKSAFSRRNMKFSMRNDSKILEVGREAVSLVSKRR